MKQYFIVNFLETKEVDLVSSEWIEGNFCWWPTPYKFSKLKNALINHEKPGAKWNKYSFKIIGSYTSYGKARKALSKAEDTSDINSDAHDYGRGQRKKKQRIIHSSSSEDSDDNFQLPPLPLAPTVEDHDVSMDSNLQLPASTSTPIEKPNSEFQTMVLRELKVIKSICRQNGEMLDTLSAIVDKINSKGNPEHVTEGQLATPLPLKNMVELDCLEEELQQSPQAVDILTKHLKILGGINFDNMVRRILRSLMDDCLASQFSWLGSKGKRPFASLHSMKCVFNAVRSNQTFVQKQDSEIELIIRNWLRHAPARCKQVKMPEQN